MAALRPLSILFVCVWAAGCANIVAPTGGERDSEPPKLLSVTPADSSLNIRPARLELRFDEYVQLGDLSALQISPLLPTPLSATATGRRVTVRLPDTSLQTNTTYSVRFGSAVQDLNEGNPAGEISYTFSTGSYFDSLRLVGQVINAATGLADADATVLLYSSESDDTAVLRSKPLYTAKVGQDGGYTFQNLPAKSFRIYAVTDKNGNLTADGGERIAFLDSVVTPLDSPVSLPMLRTFLEEDSASKDTAGVRSLGMGSTGKVGTNTAGSSGTKTAAFSFRVELDTTDAKSRFSLLDSVRISFTAPLNTLNTGRVFLSYDSAGVLVEAPLSLRLDTATRRTAVLTTSWQPDASYTLRLLKGFARDTAGTDVGPARYRFRTAREEDYGKLTVRIPTRFYGRGFVLQIQGEADTLYTAPVTDSTIRLTRLPPGSLTLRIIADSNRNGRWDPGDLLARRQPEWVYPHPAPVPIKAGWDAEVMFEAGDQRATSPGKR